MNQTRFGEHFWCRTSDGVWLHALLNPPRTAQPTVLLCHGFTGHKENEAMELLRRELASTLGVCAFDFRGHGSSAGHCTLGDLEALDVAAVARYIRHRHPDSPLVGVGFSMGGAAVVRAAALHHCLDALVAVSAPAVWRMPRKPAVMLAAVLTRTRPGRALLRKAGVRVHQRWTSPEAPVEIAEQIKVPTALVYGTHDNYFSIADGMELYEALPSPKSFLSIEGGGHGEKLATVPNAGLLSRLVEDLVERGVVADDEDHVVLWETAG